MATSIRHWKPAPSLGAMAVATLLGCTLPSENEDSVRGVGITLGASSSVSDAFLTLGDVDTIRAQSFALGLPPRVICDSESSPQCFSYSSSDTAVASVDAHGIVVTRGIGNTYLRATSDGMTSMALRLAVSPPAAHLIAAPDSIDAALGDTIAVTIVATDDHGLNVRGIVFDIGPDTTYWAVTTPPAEGDWRLETPIVLHLRATQIGSVRLTARSQNDRPSARMATDPVPVRVHQR